MTPDRISASIADAIRKRDFHRYVMEVLSAMLTEDSSPFRGLRTAEEIYWLWDNLSQIAADGSNFIIAIQKETFHGHFFLDKMEKIELEPLKPEQMLKAYLKRFKTNEPFTEEALFTLGRMSHGIFRHFLRYIVATLDLWESEADPHKQIDSAFVKRAITPERIAEDMELELSEIFPKHRKGRLQAVRLWTHLEESGPQKQSQLAEGLGLEPYALSRLVTKLEFQGYVTRIRDGKDILVSLKGRESSERMLPINAPLSKASWFDSEQDKHVND